MTKQVKASELQENGLALIDEVAATGATIVLIKDGRPVADIVPHREQDASEKKSSFGMWEGKIHIVGDIVSRRSPRGTRSSDRARYARGALVGGQIGAAWADMSGNHRLAEAGGQMAISAASIWEVALLTSKGRLALDGEASQLRDDMLHRGVLEIAIDGQIAIDAVGLDLPHRDPFDRIIVATAIAQNATLITTDRQILDWPHALVRQDASR